jgi:hypothetical protein
MKRLDLHVTEKARAWIEAQLSSYTPGSVLALSYGSFNTYGPDGTRAGTSTRWRFVVYTKDQAAQIEETSALTGEGVYEVADGVRLLIPERQDLERLAGKTLDVVDNSLTVNGRAN